MSNLMNMDEVERNKQEFKKRDASSEYRKKSSIFCNPSLYFQTHCIEMQLYLHSLSILKDTFSPENSKILDIGGGTGGNSKLFYKWGCQMTNYHCIDIVKDRIYKGKNDIPDGNFLISNGAFLPYKDRSFNIILLAMCFDSVFDKKIRTKIAHECVRCLKKDGIILFYDYRKVIFFSQIEKIRLALLSGKKDRFCSKPITKNEIMDAFKGMNVKISMKSAGMHPWVVSFALKCGINLSLIHVISQFLPFLRFYNVACIEKDS